MSRPVLLPSAEPLFCKAVERHPGGIAVYFDRDGFAACVNVAVRHDYRACAICGNCCISFVTDTDGSCTCSACGKFDREQVLYA